MSRPYAITTAISYPNGLPHMGHAYEAIAADYLARLARLMGRPSFFLTGTDEHGLKMEQAARAAGLEPRAYVDRMAGHFRAMVDRLDIVPDRFIRTTDADHRQTVEALWQRMHAAGDLYRGEYRGWYSVRDEAWWDEADLVESPTGERLAPTGTPVAWTVEEGWFFRLSRFQQPLLDLYARQPDFVRPASRLNEMRAFVERGLRDLSVSRASFFWGIPVPGDPGQVIYVWLDALANYLTPSGWPAEGWERRWPVDLHLVGKDVVRFHAVYWPAFLMSAGLPLPGGIFGHGFLLQRGAKMSKSTGNVVEPGQLAERYGVDGLRWFLLSGIAFGQDGEWDDELIVTRLNAELANGLGNLAQRTLSMIARNGGGRVPAPGPATPADRRLAQALSGLPDICCHALEAVAPHEALHAIRAGVDAANLYLSDEAPWSVRKVDPARADTILWHAADAIRKLAIVAQPAMPSSMGRLLDMLGQEADRRDLASFNAALRPQLELPAPQPLFPRWQPAEALSPA